MELQNKQNKKKIIFILINLGIFAVMLAINSVYPLCWDDKGFVERFDPNNWTIKDVFVDSYYRYYLNWSGKILPLSVATIFTLLDKTVYNIVNSIMYVIFANTIYRFFWKKKYDCWMLLAVYAALWLCIPWYGTVVFWIDGTVEYLWMLIPILIFGSIYYRYFFEGDAGHISAIGMFLLGILSGCVLEATGSALIFGIGVMLISEILQKRKIPAWQISGLAGTLIGFAILMLAPGNYARAGEVTGLAARHSNIIYRFARESFFTLLYLTPLAAVAVALTFALYKYRKTDGTDPVEPGKKGWSCLADIYVTCKEPIVLIVIAVASIYVMTFTSAFAVRIFMTPTVLLIIACGVAVNGIMSTTAGQELADRLSAFLRIVIIGVSIFMLVEMVAAFVFCLYTGDPITMNTQFTNTINDVRLFD